MLKGIAPCISPDLLKVLAEMGHGDEIILADAHFPGHSVNGRVVRADVGIAEVYQSDRGLLIATLVPGGAAERAGLKGFQVVVRRGRDRLYSFERRYIDRSAADLIVGVEGKPIKTVEEFLGAIESKSPGDVVNVNVVREGRRVDVPVELDAGD